MKSAEVYLLSLEFCFPAVPWLRLQAVRRGILFGFLNAKRHLPSTPYNLVWLAVQLVFLLASVFLTTGPPEKSSHKFLGRENLVLAERSPSHTGLSLCSILPGTPPPHASPTSFWNSCSSGLSGKRWARKTLKEW